MIVVGMVVCLMMIIVVKLIMVVKLYEVKNMILYVNGFRKDD